MIDYFSLNRLIGTKFLQGLVSERTAVNWHYLTTPPRTQLDRGNFQWHYEKIKKVASQEATNQDYLEYRKARMLPSLENDSNSQTRHFWLREAIIYFTEHETFRVASEVALPPENSIFQIWKQHVLKEKRFSALCPEITHYEKCLSFWSETGEPKKKLLNYLSKSNTFREISLQSSTISDDLFSFIIGEFLLNQYDIFNLIHAGSILEDILEIKGVNIPNILKARFIFNQINNDNEFFILDNYDITIREATKINAIASRFDSYDTEMPKYPLLVKKKKT